MSLSNNYILFVVMKRLAAGLLTPSRSPLRVLADTANYQATSWREHLADRIPLLGAGWYIDYNSGRSANY